MEFEKLKYDFKENFLWKYIDIHKFLYLVYEKKLYFTRLDKFEDPNEGLKERQIRSIFERDSFPKLEDLNKSVFPTQAQREGVHKANELWKRNLLDQAGKIQKIQFASCWFIGDRESYAMWNLYSNPDSVAIRIKPKSLLDSVEQSVNKMVDENFFSKLVCGNVHYNMVYPPEYDKKLYKKFENKYSAFKKDISYESENEYRFVAISEHVDNDIIKFELEIENFHNLDYKIISHPKMQNWMYNNILNILSSVGMENKLDKSSIKLKPNR